MRDPATGQRVWRAHSTDEVVETKVPQMRVVPDALWQQAQSRLAAEGFQRPERGRNPFWDRRRPRHLLTGKVVCGCCGRGFTAMGKDYLGCRAARNGHGCRNTRWVRRPTLEQRVLHALETRLMRPDCVAAFSRAFIAEWNRLLAESSVDVEAHRRELHAVERKLENLVEAVADGLKAAGLQKRLSELEARSAELRAMLTDQPVAAPALHPNLSEVYAQRVAELRQALQGDEGAEVLEKARALIDKVVVSPPDDPEDPPEMELVGDLIALLKTAGLPVREDGT